MKIGDKVKFTYRAARECKIKPKDKARVFNVVGIRPLSDTENLIILDSKTNNVWPERYLELVEG